MFIDYKVHSDYIEFIKYPFFCSSVYKNKKLMANEILYVTTKKFFPATIKTTSGELIFVPFQIEEDINRELEHFYKNNNIGAKKVVDIWDMILEPFLDTEFSKEDTEKTYATLEKYGLERKDCESLRQEVSKRMIAYNFESCLWDWCHLGLYDVLNASSGILSGSKHKLPNDEFEDFYWRAINIALKGFG